jgi:lipid II:glycine glycyltransferase (peptidoglycan interpeptide bridge formation enzyme)
VDGGIRINDEPLDSAWDSFVRSTPGGHHLQTSLWGQVKSLQGWRALRVRLEQGGAVVAGCQALVRRIPRLGIIAYVPRGPIAVEGNPELIAAVLEALERTLAKDRLVYLKVQPPEHHPAAAALLRDRRFVSSSLEAAPVATVRVDLNRSLDEILAAMRPRTRNHIRSSERRGAVVRIAGAEEIGTYTDLVRLTAARQGFHAYPANYYRRMWEVFSPDYARVLLVEHECHALAGTLLLAFGDTVVNKMAGWSGEKSKVHPNEFLQWAGIRWARESGYRYYDLEGINLALARGLLAGEDPPGARRGVAYFKLGFGGDVVVFPSAYDLATRPLTGRLIQHLAPTLDRWRPVAHRLLGRSA